MKLNINGQSHEIKFTPATTRRMKQLGWEVEDLPEKLSAKLPLLERFSNLIEIIWCMLPAEVIAQYPQPDDRFAEALDMALFSNATAHAIGAEFDAAITQMPQE